MIKHDSRKLIYLLHDHMSIREIAKTFCLSPTTVASIIEQKGEMPIANREDKIEIDKELLTKLYKECNGYVERVHEKLQERNIEIGYSTLTRLLRDLEISVTPKQRCDQVPDEPGSEMQQDTTVYSIKLGEKPTKLVAAILYFRYSKIRYLKFYPNFNRFQMKCFFHEALKFFGCSAKTCIIDNTNLARLVGSGTGKNAVIALEMACFSKQYGFEFKCHALGHPNRKAGNERSFFTTETNFLPGRTFTNLEDLNKQALEWATVKMFNRAVSKTDLVPAKAFEYEQTYLIKLAPYIPAPYIEHERITDQYGYVSFSGNFYWIPGTRRDNVKVLQYDRELKIYRNRELLGEYLLPAHGVKNEKIFPNGCSKPEYQPKNRKKPTLNEEQFLRNFAVEVSEFLDYALQSKGIERHRFIRQLYGLCKSLGQQVFVETVKRARQYHVTDIETIEKIAVLKMKGNGSLPLVQIKEEFEHRESYLDGKYSQDVDLTIFDKILEKKDE